MTKSKIFLILSLSFIAGIFIASFLGSSFLSIYFLAVISIIVAITGYKNKKAFIAGLAILFLAIGAWRTQSSLQKIDQSGLDGQKISEKAIVVKEPVKKDNYQQIIAQTSLGGEASKLRILINTNQFADIKYGDELEISCILKVPENFESFDYRMYLAKDKIYYICQKAQIEKTGNKGGSKIYAAVLGLKRKMEEKLDQTIPYPESALAKGLLFGGSEELPKELKNNFSRTGMTHIVAVSGYNVTIIAEYLILFGIFIGLWRQQSFWFALTGIILFVVMCGLPPSAVRAGVMGSLLIWAMKNGRLANSWNAVIFAAGVMLLVNPLLLRWDIGFQLSFLATLGIISFAPFWEKRLIKKHRAFGFMEILFLSASAQIFVLPIILYNFHTLSLVSLGANLLILLVVPLSMLLAFLVAATGLVSIVLATPLAWLSFLTLRYEVWVIETLGGLGWASKNVDNFRWEWIILWYLLLALAAYLLKSKIKSQISKA